MKTSFEILEYNFGILLELCPGANTFAEAWQAYLQSCGWTEEAFEEETERRIYLIVADN